MKFLRLELVDFKRFSLNGISNFNITFKECLQLILGTNGSGKSSLLQQLTPLPPEQKDFLKSGKKKIEIEHLGSHFVLTSVFSPKQEHSFIVDGVEKNDGGTITIQKELVKTYFGITPEIQDLILGQERFDLMSTSRRKEWFIKLCDTDYQYAIGVYNRLKERHRDTSGAVKLAKKRLVSESEKLIKEDEEIKLLEDVKNLHKTLNILLEIRKPVEDDLDIININQQDLDKTLVRYTNTLKELLTNLENEVMSVEDIDNRISLLEMKIYSLSDQISKLIDEHKENEVKINVLQRAEEATIDSIKEDIKHLQNVEKQLLSNLLVPQMQDPRGCHNTLQSIRENLSNIFTSIPINSEKLYSSEQLTISKDKLDKLYLEKERLTNSIQEAVNAVRHMEEHKNNPDTMCPNCSFKFSLKYDPLTHKGLNKKILSESQHLNTVVKQEIAKLEDYIENCTLYSVHYRQFIMLTRNWPNFNHYWDYLLDQKILTNNPRHGVNLINLFELDIINQIKLSDLNTDLSNKRELLESIEKVGGTDLNTLIARNKSIDEKLEYLTKEQTDHVNTKKEFEKRKGLILSVDDLISKIKRTMNSKRELHRTELETLRRIHLNNTIRELQSYLASKESVLYNFSLQKNLVEDISNQIKSLEKNEKALAYLLAQLSPTEGLIAEGLLGFINVFVNQMNHFIKKIWTYPLVIKPCGISDGEQVDIDYKFPLVVKTNDNIVPDISKGSTGMLEIINLAFRITAMQYLGLKHYPLGLDEWGSGFDNAHRDQAVNAIKSLIDQNIFDQLFVISHYAEAYGALSNPEICVLDDTNITLPKLNSKVNEHVVIN